MTGLRAALFASLAVNVLLVGVVGGAALSEWRGERTRTETAVARAPNMRAILGALPPERAAAVRARVIETWQDAREDRQRMRQARMAALRTAAADPYDAAATQRAFGEMRAADAVVTARFHDVIAQTLGEMTVEERRDVLRRLATRRQALRGALAEDDEASPAP
ncbi:MAG: periplasmic heavy metal sensor [Hyphomonadaceae bacterium]|nr:periplasmic heavy metal sensor [Hyphomonadaceae bacterium]